MIVALFALGLLVLACSFYNVHWKRRRLPPGPIPLPLFGNTLAIAGEPPGYRPWQRWARQFGPFYTVWFGEDPVVVVTDFSLIKNTFVMDGDAYAGRDFMLQINKLFTGLLLSL